MLSYPVSSLLFLPVGAAVGFSEFLLEAFPSARIESLSLLTEVKDKAKHHAGVSVVIVRDEADAKALDRPDTRSEFGAPSWAVLIWDTQSSTVTRSNLQALVSQALQRYKLEIEVARLRGDLRTFSRRITHDLRSPLNAISTSAEVIREVLAERMPEEVELTDPIIESAREILPVLDQLTIITRATAIPTERKDFAMEDAVHNTLDRFTARAMAKGATIQAADNWPKVHGVLGWTESIWAQLLANSLAHGGEKPRIQLGWEPRPERIRFWIQDSGSVPEEKRSRLFHPFNLRHQSDAPHGMGLSIVQRLVELQDGEVGYAALPEGGSRFYFDLPPAEKP